MSRTRAVHAWTLENPILERLLATRYTGLSLGLVYLLVTGVLLVTDVILLANSAHLGPAGSLRTGQLLHGIHCLVLTGLITVLVPSKVAGAGAIDGLRTDRALDQLVVTGVSPVRYLFGNLALGWLYGLSFLFVSLPFEMHAWLLGGVSLGGIAAGFGMLALYSGFLVTVTLGLIVREPERHAALGVVVLGLIAGSLAFAPLPAALAELTPVRFFLRQDPLWGPWVGLDPRLLRQDPVIFFGTVPLGIYPMLLWTFLSLPFVLLVLTGPSHRFRRGQDNFGGSTSRSGGKDRWLSAFGGGLGRRVDLAFLYENRPRWLDPWSAPLRYTTALVFAAAICGFVVGTIFPGGVLRINPARIYYYHDRPFLALVVTGGFLLFVLLLCGDTRSGETWRVRFLRWRIPRGRLLTASALVLIVGFAGLHAGILESGVLEARAAIEKAAGSTARTRSGEGVQSLIRTLTAPRPETRELARLDTYATTGRWALASATLLLLNVHFAGKILSLFVPVAFLWRFALLCGAGLLLVGPILLLRTLEERWVPWSLQPVTYLSPFVLGSGKTWNPSRDMDVFFPRHILALTVLLGALLATGVLLRVTLRKVRERQKKHRGAGGPPRTLTVALLLLVGLAVPSALPGQAASTRSKLPVELRATHAFEGRLFQETLDFVVLVVENRGMEMLEGTVHLDDGFALEPTRPQALQVPPGTTTVVRWTVPWRPVYESASWNGRVVLETPRGTAVTDLAPLAQSPAVLREAGTPRVLVVDDRPPEERAALPGARRQVSTWSVCRSLFLPEDPLAYGGVDALVVARSDITRWTDLQRATLYNTIRCGGTVVFSGDPRTHGLSTCAPWDALLRRIPAPRPDLPGVELAPCDFEEGRVAWKLDLPGVESPVPLLVVRAVGPGRVGLLSFDVLRDSWRQALPPHAGTWQALEEHLPTSRYPSVLTPGGGMILQESPEGSWLFATLLYFTPYVLLLGPGVMLLFAGRKRRRWLPVVILGSPGLFLLGLPGLAVLLESRRSGAVVNEVVVFGSGSRLGVAYASLGIQSRGRQEHTVRLGGERLAAFRVDERTEWDFRARSEPRLAPVRAGGSAAWDAGLEGDRFRFRMPPWGSGDFLLLGDLAVEQPARGSVTYERATRQLHVQARGLPWVRKGAPALVVCRNLRGPGSYESFGLAVEEGGSVTKGLQLEGGAQMRREFATVLDFPQPTLGNYSGRLRLQTSRDSRPLAFLILALEKPPLPVETEDLVFESEIGPGPDVPTGQAERTRRRLRTHIASGGRDLIEQDGRFLLRHRLAAVVLELPVTLR